MDQIALSAAAPQSADGPPLNTVTQASPLAAAATSVRRLWRLANSDFCPNQNAWAYQLKRPVVLLSIAAALGLFCGFAINPLAYLVGGTLVLVVLIGLAWPAIAVRAAEVEVDWGRSRTVEGQTVGVKLRVRNRLPVPLGGLVVTGLDGLDDAKLPMLRPRERRVVQWQATCLRRGVFPLAERTPNDDTAISDANAGGAAIQTQMPFGVWTATQPIAVAGRLVVQPATTPLEGLVDLGEPRDGEERPTDRRAGTTGDLLGVRRFREGDSLRHVHWAQTARQRELIVCERQATIAAAVRVGVDLPGDADRLEKTIRAAASVARRLVEGGTGVELVLPDRTLRSDGPLTSLLDGLAAVGRSDRDRTAPSDVSLRLGYDARCRMRLEPTGDWRAATAAAWRRLCRAA